MLRSFSSRLLGFTLTLGLALASCGGPPEVMTEATSEKAAVAEADQANFGPEGGEAGDAPAPDAPPDAQTVKPQLIKTASLVLEVESVAEAIADLGNILKQQQGDILELSHQQPDNSGGQEFASLQVRVPQARLEATLDAFSELGQVTSETISAQDVSDQLVDLGARLRNLRKAEESLLEILDRAGSMSDVLAVSQELRSVRQEIEQIDARRSDLQNRVAYSTITVQLDALVTTYPDRNPLGRQFGQTWQAATRSLQDFTVGFLRLLLWLLVWSPYWGGLMLLVFLVKKWRKQMSSG
ncbi:MAG: DUF4349 domain-containing protein [Cyanobacteria bacterium P01_G01_bin.54]